ncbi:MAG: hypothetical protein U0414_38025 [Polyangiaceae bacterium]
MQQPPPPPYGHYAPPAVGGPPQGYGTAPGYGTAAPTPQGMPPQAVTEKPVDPMRMLIGVVGCGLFALSAIIAMVTRDDPSKFTGLLFTFVELLGLMGMAAGFSGLRTLPGMLAAGGNAVVGICALCIEALAFMEFGGVFLWQLAFVALNGWMFISLAANAGALAASHRKTGPIAFAGVGLWALAALVGAYFLFRAVMYFFDQPVSEASTAVTIAEVVHLLAALATGAVFLVARARASTPAPARG